VLDNTSATSHTNIAIAMNIVCIAVAISC